MIRHRIVAGVVAGVALVSLAACGSDSKSSDTTAKAVTTTEAAAPTTTAGASATTDAGSATTDAGSATTDSDISIPDISTPELTGNCVELGKDMESVFGADFDPTTANAEDIKKVFDKLESKVPSDLKDDVQTLSDAVQPFYAALAAAGGDMTKALQDPNVQKAMTAMSSPDVQAASTALDEWTTKGCPSS